VSYLSAKRISSLSLLASVFLTGLLLQVAFGRVFFFILNVALQRTLLDGLLAVVAVTAADYIYISLAFPDVGGLLEKKRVRSVSPVVGEAIRVAFGIARISSDSEQFATSRPSYIFFEFSSAFALTISNRLTVAFWTSIFATRDRKVPHETSVVALTYAMASIPAVVIRVLNVAVGSLTPLWNCHRWAKVDTSEADVSGGKNIDRLASMP